MANDMLCTADGVRAAADLLTGNADAIKTRRRLDFDAGKITADEADDSIADETELREHATRLYIQAADMVLSSAQQAQADLELAIQTARSQILSLAEFKAALMRVTALITLAGAILSKQPSAIETGLKDLQTALTS